MLNVDFRLLDFCSDDDCIEFGVHRAHGRKARAVTVKRGADVDDVDDVDVGPSMVLVGIDRVESRRMSSSSRDPDHWQARLDLAKADALMAEHSLDVDTDGKACQALVASAYVAVSDHVPRSFREIYYAVINDYGEITTRGVNRALVALISHRKVASLTNPWWSSDRQRSEYHPGWYIRYDSPKLWRAGGLRDLLRVVAEQDTERVS